MSLILIAGTAAEVFPPELASVVEAELRLHFPALAEKDGERYESEPLDAGAWRALQQSVLRTLEHAPQLTAIEAYQAVYVPLPLDEVRHLAVGSLADPLQVGSLPALLAELARYAERTSLPSDDVELMQLALRYFEGDSTQDPDVQMYVQLLLSARQAVALDQPLWVVV